MPEDHPWVVVCTECHSDQVHINPEKNTFIKNGIMPPCKYCAGVTIVVAERGHRGAALAQADRERGLYQEPE